jgi:Eco29kI restriction endonuclease
MPLWNSALDGFGNHDPGNGRYNQAKSDWDVIHPGRAWADRCKGVAADKPAIIARIKEHLASLG